MALYRFVYREDFADEVFEAELAHDEAACQEAVRAAQELMAAGIFEGVDRTGWVSRVYDDAGRVVTTVKFSDLLTKRGSLS